MLQNEDVHIACLFVLMLMVPQITPEINHKVVVKTKSVSKTCIFYNYC